MVNIFRYVGIGKETDFGNAVDGTIFLDPESSTLDAPSAPEILIEGGMGRMTARKRPGFYSCAGNIVYPVDINSIGYLLRGALDQYMYTVSDLLHEFWGENENQLTSWTYHLGKDVAEFVYDGCMINSLDLSVEGNLARATVGLFARKDTPAELKNYSDFSALIPTAYPLAFYNVTAMINDVESSAICRSTRLTINNNLNRESGRSLASMYPATFRCGARVTECQLELQFNDLKHNDLFWGGAEGPSCDGSTPFPLKLNFDGGDDGDMEIQMPNCTMTSIPTQPRGRDTLYQTITCRALLAPGVVLHDESTVDTEIYVVLANEGGTLA